MRLNTKNHCYNIFSGDLVSAHPGCTPPEATVLKRARDCYLDLAQLQENVQGGVGFVC